MTVQDRTSEFQSCVSTMSRRFPSASASRQNLIAHASGSSPLLGGEKQRKVSKSEFARRAAEIGRQITATVGKLERLAQLAKRRTLFDDRPVEIAELTYIIKQDLSAINQAISSLQMLNKANQNTVQQQVGEHSKNVVVLLQGKLAAVSTGFKEVLEVRTKNIQRGRERTDHFVSTVRSGVESAQAQEITKSHSPLYATPTQSPPPQSDLLSLDPQSQQQQALMLEEPQTDMSYLNSRSDAITAIESTIHELGGIFSQLAQMVSEQTDMIQRIDANTEDVVTNVSGAQRELMKYWGRVSSNRWLVAKMFGVLMIFFLLWVLVS